MAQEENIRVVIRCRGRNARETEMQSMNIVELDPSDAKITLTTSSNPNDSAEDLIINESKLEKRQYKLDAIYGPGDDQVLIFDDIAKKMCDDFLDGFNCSILAYGQTGSGKTHTMFGKYDEEKICPESGIVPRVLKYLFDNFHGMKGASLKCSFMEIYNEDLRDLLTPNQRDMKITQQQNKVIKISGLEHLIMSNVEDGFKFLNSGLKRRETKSTKINQQSSRSHTIFTIHMFRKSKDGKDDYLLSKFNLVDLAGSENIRKSGSVDKMANEAGNINKSLLTLGKVINTLSGSNGGYIPYRDSKLTRVLQDSFGGDTKTTLIATISPTLDNLHSTISTLNYASKAKNIKNSVQIGKLVTEDLILEELILENKRLQDDLWATRQRDGKVFIDLNSYAKDKLIMKNLKDELTQYKLENETLKIRNDELKISNDQLLENLKSTEMNVIDLRNELNDKFKENQVKNYEIGQSLLNEIDLSLKDTNNNNQNIFKCFNNIRDKISELDEDNKFNEEFDLITSQLSLIESNIRLNEELIKSSRNDLDQYQKLNFSIEIESLNEISQKFQEHTELMRIANQIDNDNNDLIYNNQLNQLIKPKLNEILKNFEQIQNDLINDSVKFTKNFYLNQIKNSYIKSQKITSGLTRNLTDQIESLEKIQFRSNQNDTLISQVGDSLSNDFEPTEDLVADLQANLQSYDAMNKKFINENGEKLDYIKFKIDELFNKIDFKDDDCSIQNQLKDIINEILMKPLSILSPTKYPHVTRRSVSPKKKQSRRSSQSAGDISIGLNKRPKLDCYGQIETDSI